MRPLVLLCAIAAGLLAVPVDSRAWFPERYSLDAILTSEYQTGDLLGIAEPPLLQSPSLESSEVRFPFASASRHSLKFLESDASRTALVSPGEVSLEESSIANIDFEVPSIRSGRVDRHLQFFSFHIRDRFEQWLRRLERYRPAVQRIFAEFKLPDDLIFLSLVESGFNTQAVSRARAVGPWQFIKPTAKTYGLRVDKWVDERRDPVKSTVAAAQYLRDLYEMFGSWPLAMAAYNAGEGKVGRALARRQVSDFWGLVDTKLLRRETKEYVPRFLAAAQIAKDPSRYGFSIVPQSPVEYEEVAITRPLHLRVAGQAAGVSYEQMKNLNPELRRDMTPPDAVYILKVPVGSKELLLANLPRHQEKSYQASKPGQTTRRSIHRKDTLRLSRLSGRHASTQSPWALKAKTAPRSAQVLAKSTP